MYPQEILIRGKLQSKEEKSFLLSIVCMFACVCVCVQDRKETIRVNKLTERQNDELLLETFMIVYKNERHQLN